MCSISDGIWFAYETTMAIVLIQQLYRNGYANAEWLLSMLVFLKLYQLGPSIDNSPQLAYDVHMSRMIPQLVIILEEEMCTSGNIVTNSRMTPSWREIVSLTVLVKLAFYT
nr:hypothetical protein [Tanacetum cinerariifolium]